MPKRDLKDMPLLLRRRSDGLHLSSPKWPARHEFSNDWLLATPEASVDGDEIRLELVNARAVYTINRDDDHVSSGLWGYLAEGTVD